MEKEKNTDRILRMHEVSVMVGLAPSTIYELQNTKPPRFPKSFKIVRGGRAAGWLQSQITKYLEDRAGA